MAQGLKPLKSNSVGASKAKSTAQQKKAAQPKKGARVIPAKKQAALRAATNKRRQTSSVAGNVEQEMIGRAASGGPLRLLKPPPKTDEDAKGKGKK
ncbi:unnamed protein product [Jaminaea pallidilutea]